METYVETYVPHNSFFLSLPGPWPARPGLQVQEGLARPTRNPASVRDFFKKLTQLNMFLPWELSFNTRQHQYIYILILALPRYPSLPFPKENCVSAN